MSQFEGYEDLMELDWDALSRALREHPAPRPDPARRGRRPRPLQARQAGRHGDAVLPLHGRAAARRSSSGSATSTAPDSSPANDRLLRPADLARVDAQPHHPRRRAGADRPGELMAALPDRLGERHRRHPGRHDQGGHPYGRHVGNARPRPARLPRHRDPRRCPALQPAPDRSARRPVAPDAVPPHRHPRGARPYAS